MREQIIARGLQTLLSETRRYADSFPQKLQAMQEIYLQRNSDLYSKVELQQLRYYLKAVSYKFYLATLSLEQLWALSHTKRNNLFYALQNGLDRLECSDDELLLSSFALESFLFQSRAFLDFCMLYICLFLRTGHTGKMSREKFGKELAKVQQIPFNEKAQWAKEYFDAQVFGRYDGRSFHLNHWGTLLISLRDKIAHRDRLRPSFNSDETLIGQVLFDWPTLQDITYDRFCQYMQNGMFSLVTDVFPVLYEL